MPDTQTSDIVEHVSPHSFGDTLKRLTAAIANAGMTLFASIDHADNARRVEATMPAATVLIYGNAKGGTPIMVGTPPAALDLPLRVLVQQRSDSEVIVAFHPVASMLQRAGVPAEVAVRLEPAQRLLLVALKL